MSVARGSGDRPLPEDAAIEAAFPTRSGRHDLYAIAMRLVGAKYSKGALVALVNMLLHRAEMRDDLVGRANELPGLTAALDELRHAAGVVLDNFEHGDVYRVKFAWDDDDIQGLASAFDGSRRKASGPPRPAEEDANMRAAGEKPESVAATDGALSTPAAPTADELVAAYGDPRELRAALERLRRHAKHVLDNTGDSIATRRLEAPGNPPLVGRAPAAVDHVQQPDVTPSGQGRPRDETGSGHVPLANADEEVRLLREIARQVQRFHDDTAHEGHSNVQCDSICEAWKVWRAYRRSEATPDAPHLEVEAARARDREANGDAYVCGCVFETIVRRSPCSAAATPVALCGEYLGDNDGTCPQLTCIRKKGHAGLHDNVRGDGIDWESIAKLLEASLRRVCRGEAHEDRPPNTCQCRWCEARALLRNVVVEDGGERG